MTIIRSKSEDIPKIFALYNEAIAYQKSVKGNVWKGFEVSLVEREIAEERHYVIKEETDIACTFVLAFDDEIIWKEANKDKAVYIHRIAVNPNFRGKGYVKIIINWIKENAKNWDLDYIRLDTESGNEGINQHYLNCGFTYKGLTKVNWEEGMPLHYKNATLSLFEIIL